MSNFIVDKTYSISMKTLIALGSENLNNPSSSNISVGSTGLVLNTLYMGSAWKNLTNTGIEYDIVSISSTGQYQAVINQTNIFISSNYGSTWTTVSSFDISPTGGRWINISMSLSGQYMTATYYTSFYTSSDYGITWNRSFTPNSTNSWTGISISSTGQYQTVVSTGTTIGGSIPWIYLSSDYGKTWVPILTTFNNQGYDLVKISSTGQYQIVSTISTAGQTYGLCMSSDYGNTWSFNSNLVVPISSILNISISSSGQYQTIAVFNSGLWYSKDYGSTFHISDANTNAGWVGLTMTSTGQYQIATASSFRGTITPYLLYISVNYGVNWVQIMTTTLYWADIMISSTGQYIIASAGTTNNTAINDIYLPWTPTQ